MPSKDDYQAAGLYDPAVDAGTGRFELLEWLDAKGFTLDEMVHAHPRIGLGALAGDRRMLPGARVADAEAVRISGLSEADFDRVVTALGFVPETDDGQFRFTEHEARNLAQFGVLDHMFTEDEGLGFLRVLGSALARVAEAAISMFLTDVESPHLAKQGDELELAQKVYEAVGLLDELAPAFDPLLRRHMLQATERSRQATIDQTERLRYRYAIGFVDLVGFTPLTHTMTARELGDFVRDFEAKAHASVTEAGARLVKLIGDEVMFVAPDADAACAAASALMTAFTDEHGAVVVPAGGLAYGEVRVRGGDYYGEIVNLASRLVNEAVPRELLVTKAFAEAAKGAVFEPAGRRMLKGFVDPVEVLSLSFA